MLAFRFLSASAVAVPLAVFLSLVSGPIAAQTAAEVEVSWFMLGKYEYNADEQCEKTPSQKAGTIPADIKALDGKKVKIYGILKAVDAPRGGMATKMIMTSTADNEGGSLGTCGDMLRINEWVDVQLVPGQSWKVPPDVGTEPEATVYGSFSIKEVVSAEGKVTALYHILADRVTQ